jgi:hypothetical protein
LLASRPFDLMMSKREFDVLRILCSEGVRW